MKDNQ